MPAGGMLLDRVGVGSFGLKLIEVFQNARRRSSRSSLVLQGGVHVGRHTLGPATCLARSIADDSSVTEIFCVAM